MSVHILKKGDGKMKGYIIDGNYLYHVKNYMAKDYPTPRLKKPTRKLFDIDGSRMPIIMV